MGCTFAPSTSRGRAGKEPELELRWPGYLYERARLATGEPLTTLRGTRYSPARGHARCARRLPNELHPCIRPYVGQIVIVDPRDDRPPLDRQLDHAGVTQPEPRQHPARTALCYEHTAGLHIAGELNNRVLMKHDHHTPLGRPSSLRWSDAFGARAMSCRPERSRPVPGHGNSPPPLTRSILGAAGCCTASGRPLRRCRVQVNTAERCTDPIVAACAPRCGQRKSVSTAQLTTRVGTATGGRSVSSYADRASSRWHETGTVLWRTCQARRWCS